jgi:hypothetical protein
MNPGDSVHNASRPTSEETGGHGAAAGAGSGQPTRSPGALKLVQDIQDIQDIIDKLAAVTQQLRHPAGHRG